jgi:hypothetical protein
MRSDRHDANTTLWCLTPMNLTRSTVIASAVVLMACASEPCFYSFVARSFLRLSDDPVRKELVGTWRTSEGHVLALSSDGRFQSSVRGCWDIDRNQLFFLQRCVNYGATQGTVTRGLLEMTDQCNFALRNQQLVVNDCSLAGVYSRTGT